MNEIAILQRKVLGLAGDDGVEWENVAFTTCNKQIHEWMSGAHMYEKRKYQFICRQS